MTRYSVRIYWSDEDDVYIAEVPELPGCMTHGATRADAVANAEEAMELWIEVAREFGDPVPEPQGRPLTAA
jgi:predicted RNase H-like HicB family nuclease